MTDERLEELERLCESATDGPWKVNYAFPMFIGTGIALQRGNELGTNCGVYLGRSESEVGPDARLIAESRTAMPELIAEVRRLRSHNTLLMEEVGDRESYWDKTAQERKDAERYRWLRDRDLTNAQRPWVTGKDLGCEVALFGESLDAAIDAAMQGDSE